MTTTIAFDLITQLVVTCRANVPAGTTVYDGQGAAADDTGNFLMVGIGDPNSQDPEVSAAGTQEWAAIGNRAGNEEGTVHCCAVAWSGDIGSDAQQQVREDVRDIVADVDAALRADPNLGGTVPGLMWVRYGRNYSLEQISATDGVAAVFKFDIDYRARI